MTEQQTIGQVGEFDLIALATRGISADQRVALGPGDDAAVLNVPSGRVVVSTDTLVEGVHFRRDWSSGIEVGRKAVAESVADLEAMGADPIALVVGFSGPDDLPVTWLRYLLQGIHEECERAGIALAGGDMTRSRDVMLAMTVLGETGERAPVTRAGARPGDVVAVRGRLGWSAAGLAVLGRGFRSPRAVVEAHKVPEPPYGQGRAAAESGATAMIDVSDGLLGDLGHIATASGVAIDVQRSAFEIADPMRAVAAATGADPMTFILTGGEDHALAATFPAGSVPAGWRVVGRVSDPGESGPGVTVDGAAFEGDQGFQHFGR